MTANEFVLIIAPAAAGQAGPPPPVYEPEYQAYLNDLDTRGIPQPPANLRAKGSQLVADLKAAVGWGKIASLRVYQNNAQGASLVDLKRLYLMSLGGTFTPTHTEAKGWYNNFSGRIETGFFPNSATADGGQTYVVIEAPAAGLNESGVNNNPLHAWAQLGPGFSTRARYKNSADTNTNLGPYSYPLILTTWRENTAEFKAKAGAGATQTRTAAFAGGTIAFAKFDLATNTFGNQGNGLQGHLAMGIDYVGVLSEAEVTAVHAAILAFIQPPAQAMSAPAEPQPVAAPPKRTRKKPTP